MSIKPIDFQVILPKTSEISKVHNDENYKSRSTDHQKNLEIKTQVDENLRQVHSQDKPYAITGKDERNKNNGNKNNKKNNNQEKKRGKKVFRKKERT